MAITSIRSMSAVHGLNPFSLHICGRWSLATQEGDSKREGAEGNTTKDCMRQTPSRVSTSSGLERVRERAKAEKKERFTALLHHVDVDLLRTALFRPQVGRMLTKI
jgi:hypothetical protein